jgi:DNA-binding CsgD family transcriptional regulator
MILAGYHLPLVAVARGDTRAGLDAVDRTVEDMSARGVGLSAQFAHHVRALAAIGRGDFGEAYEQACAISPAGSFAPHTPQALWVVLELVEGATRSGRRASARAHVEAMEAAGIANLSPRLALCVAGCAAMVADTSDSYEKALAVRDADRWPFDQGRIRLAYGEHLRRKRRTDAARIQLTAALQIFQQLGARPWILRTSNALRAVGHSTAQTADDHVTLSAQERRIAELAAAGLSNREIGDRLHLSHRTVSSHLYRVFPKLGVTSRTALRDALSEQSR